MATKALVCLVMIAAASAVPLMRNDFESTSESYQCARKCSGNTRKFNYKTSETYVYEYKAEAETSVAGDSADKAQMQIEAHANIEVIDECEFALRLQNVKVYHSAPYHESLKPAERSQEFQRALTENTLRFAFDNGVIGGICHPAQEKVWVLNFKRGLLSAFQNSMNSLTRSKTEQIVKEIDVSGECEVDYTSEGEVRWSQWKSTKVTKSKNLLACRKHSGLKTFIPMVPYKLASDVQSLPIMDSTQECEQIVTRATRILESSVCKEKHVFAPLSKYPSGAATTILQTLTFKAVKSGIETRQDSVETRSSLLFQHGNGIDQVPNSKEAAEQKLKEICEQTKVDIRPETPRLFTELVQIVKDLDSSDLRNLYRMIKSKKLCSQNDKSMKFLLDSLPIAGTPGAVELMATVINADDIVDVEKNVWLTSLSLISEPSEEMLPSLMKLLNGKSADTALLPVSALLNTMCKKTVNCDRSYQFKKIVNKINSNIDRYIAAKDLSKAMETLRAIGNIGYGETFLKTIKTLLTSQNNPLEVKVAAADAFRRFECQEDEETGPLFEVFESQDADSELRIMSFLSLMRCPRDSVLQKIAAQLDKEEDVQVGAFVYTHLENLKQTSDPHKQDIAQAVGYLSLKKFDASGLKTSRCFESSTLLNRLNLGYVADGDLIWSQSSSVPRAMRLNLTVELFGNSVNLFEAGARVDGLDQFIKKYFGVEGYFAQNEAKPEDLEAFIYARMFGNELFFKHMKGTQEYENFKSYLSFEKILENLSKKYNFGYTHSQQLMDHSLIIPTAIGLPVNLTINSSVTVDTNAKGKVDFSGILSRSKPIAVSADIAVSAGLEVSGSMMVDAQLYKQGLRMRNTLHTSVSMKSNLMIKERQIVNFEIESPQEKQELFDARSQLFVIHDNIEKEQEIKENSNQINECTDDQFSKVTGMELCGDLQYPNGPMTEDAPYFPLSGPVRATLVMNKKDTQRSYKIFAKWIKNSKKLEAQLQLDTPGSQVDRHISADVTIGTHKSPHVDVVLISPWKKIVLNGKAAKNNDMASLTGSLAVDEDIHYKLTSELKMNSKAKTHQYIPFVEIENNGERITLVSGSATHNEKKDMTSNLELKDLSQNTYNLGGRLVYSPQEKRIELTAGRQGEKPYLFRTGSIFKKSGKKNNIKIDPELLIQYSKGEIISLKSNGEFQSKPLKVITDITLNTIGIKRPVTLKVDVGQKRQSYPISVKLTTPVITGSVKGKVNVRKNSYSSDMKILYTTGSTSDRISWSGKLLDRSKGSYNQYNMNSNLRFKAMPEYNIISSLDVTQKMSKGLNTYKNDAELTIYYGKKARVDKTKVIQVVTSVNADFKKAELKADLKVKAPEKNVDIKMELDHHVESKKLDSEIKLHLAPLLEDDITANIRLRNKGRSLYAITADASIEAGGQKYSVNSDLNQKSQRRYEHSLTVSHGDKDKHTLVTVYKNAQDVHHILTTLDSTLSENPLSIDLLSDVKNPSDFHISGSLKEIKRELYSLDASSKLEEGVAGKWKLELAHPSRKMRVQANFNNVNSRMTTDASLNWDVGSKEKPAPEVALTGQFTHISGDDSLLLKGNVKLNTPFKNLEKLHSNWNLEKSESDLKSTGKLSWGGIHKQFTTGLTAKLPISIENAKVSFEAKTPFKNYKDVEVEIDHMLNSEIKTTLKGKLNRDQAELILNGKKDINDYSRSIAGDLTLKTPYRSARQVVLSLDHSDDENGIKSNVKINKDGQEYSADMLSSLKYDSERSGQLKLSGPERSTQTSFTHKIDNGKHQIEASIDSAMSNKKRRYNVDITGHFVDLNNLKLNVDVKSPLKSLRKGGLELGLENEDGTLENKIIFVQNRGKTGYDIKLKNKENEKSVDVLLLLSPMYEKDIYLKTSVQSDNYPVTISSQFSWAPSTVIDLTGSYKAQNIDDLEVSLKLTTPFESLENINLEASNVLRNSIRVSHLNVDYDVRKMIDVEVRSQNDEEKKLLRLKVKVPSFPFESLDTGVSIDMTRGLYAKTDMELLVESKSKYEGVVSVRISQNKNVRGKLDIKTPVEGFEHIEGSLVSESKKSDSTNTLQLTLGDEKLIDVTATIRPAVGEYVSYKVITQGTLFQAMAEDYSDFMKKRDLDHFLVNVLKYRSEIAKKLTVEIEVEKVYIKDQWTVSLIPEFEKSGQHELVLVIGIISNSLKDFSVESTLTIDEETTRGDLEVRFLDDIKFLSSLQFPGKRGEGLALEFSLSGDADQFESKGRVQIYTLESNYDLVLNSIQRIEFTSTLKTKNRIPSDAITIKYTHDGQDNRASCSLSVEHAKELKASIDIVGQTSPIHLFSFTVKTPFSKDYKKMVISGDYDETKVNGLVEFNGVKQFYLSGTHNDFNNPKFTLKTPLRLLQVLSINADGQLSDGSSSFSLQFNDNDQIDGNVAIKYDGPAQMELISTLNTNIDSSVNNLKLEVENSVTPRKTSRFLLSMNDVDKIIFSSSLENDYNGNEKLVIDSSVMYPSLGTPIQGLVMNLDGNTEKATGNIELLDGSGKILDADINIDILSDKKAVLTIRQPTSMEYSFTQGSLQNGNELVLNWDRTDPDANLVIGVTFKDDSNYYKLDKSVSLRLSCPSRSVGVEHAIIATKSKMESSGRLFWNSDLDSQVSYDLNLKDQSNRRQNSYDGELKLKLPTRTVGITGSASDRNGELQGETTLSWDMDYDATKKVGLKGTLLKGPHTQADISLILPQDAHVDSKLVMNKGNTIIEGETQIFFSQDSSKTLTLFSKLENIKENSGFFSSSEGKTNYSIQLGVRHPDSRIDVKLVSHLGYDAERWTTSVGLDYLTSRRQVKNLDLFMEIDKIKKQINFVTVTPYKSIGISGTIISHNPAAYKASMTVDDMERYALDLLVDPQLKKANLDWTKYGTKFSYSAFFPNKNTLKIQRNQEDDISEQDYKIVFQLPRPDVFQTTLNWRLGLMEEARDRIFDNMRVFWREMKDTTDDVVSNIKREVEEKYRDVSTSIFDDAKSFVDSLEQEIILFENDIDLMERKLQQPFDFCSVPIKEYMPIGEYLINIVNIRPQLTKLRDDLQSLSKSLVEWKSIPAETALEDVFKTIRRVEYALFRTRFYDLFSSLYRVSNEEFESDWDDAERFIKRLNPQQFLDGLNEKMNKLKNTKLSTFIAYAIEKNTIVSNDVLNEIKEFLENPKISDFGILKMIQDIIAEEVSELLNTIPVLRNPVTRFDPEKGVLQVQVPLFVSLDRLDQLPSFENISDQIFDYLPEQLYGGNASSSINEVITQEDVMDGFSQYQPSPRVRLGRSM